MLVCIYSGNTKYKTEPNNDTAKDYRQTDYNRETKPLNMETNAVHKAQKMDGSTLLESE